MDRALSTLKLRGKSSKDLSTVATCTKEYPTDPACYELLEDCGRGVSATVHRALCKSNGEVVAVKKMNLERVSMTLDEIIHEAQTMKSYNHSNVLPLYTSFVHGQDLWMVTPFMAGGSVLHIMKYQFSEGLDEVVIATIMKYVLQGLEYVHKNGGIHRDVKAGNILIDRDGTVRIGDFGVAATIERGGSWGNDKMVRTTFVGTPCWMAPEVMEQTQGYDSSADIWSFGITMLELANGHAPFAKFPPMKVLLMTLQNPPPQLDDKQGRKHFSKQMRNLVARCLQKDPRSRPSATELLQDKFFKQARDEEFLRQALMTGIPNLGERVQQIRVGKAATTAADNDKQLERSQEEYVKGVSSWNFDLAALKAQAASEPDDGSVPQTPTFPAMPTIMEGPEAVEGEGSGEGSRRSTDDAAAVPMTPVVSPTTSAGGAGVLVQQQPVQVAQQQQGQQQQMAVQEMVAVVQQQTVAVQQQQQLGSMQQPIVQVTQQQTVAVQQQLDVGAVASQLQQQQQQSNAANMRRASSAFAGSTALAAAAAAASASIHPAAAAVGHAQLQGHFSEPAAVVLSQQQSATAAINIMGGTSGGSSYCVSPLNGSPPMSRESSSQGPLGALAATPENISLKGKSKGRHGRFQVYEHGEEPPPMSPPANKALHEGLSGSFSRAVDGRLSDPAAEAPAIAASSTKQTPEIEGLLAAAVAGHVSAGPPVAPLCNGSGPAHHVPGGVVIGFAAGTDGGPAAADGGAVPGSGSATPPLPPAGPSAPVAGLAVSGTLSEGLDATGTTEPKKRGRFKIIEEEPSVSSRGSSVSKVPSSADLGKSSALRGALTGPGVMLELQKLHEQAINHQQALGGLIDRMKVGGSLGNLASAGEEGSAVAAVSAAGVARKLSNTGSLSRSTSNKTLGGGLDLRQLTLQLMLPAYDNSMEEVAEKLLERGQDLERRLSEVLEENQRLRLKLALSDAGVGVGVYGGGDSFGGSGAAGAGSSSNMAAILAAGLRSELGDGSNQLSRPVSRRASAANQGIPSNPGFSGQQQQQGAAAAAAGSGLSSGGGQGVAGGGLGDRYSSGGASADSNGSSAAAAAAASGVGGDGAARGNGPSINEAVGAAAGAVDAATPAGAGPAAGAGSLARDSVAAMFWKG